VKRLTLLASLAAAAVFLAPVSVAAAPQLLPILTSGLTSPVFAGHAGDGSNRLFIVERGGIIKVLQPDRTTLTTFLNISSRVQAGGEQGLLGLAFHPLYESNGRFFVYYTRTGGEIVIAEYHVSADPNIASTAEDILLTIPHPTNTNHNGGMMAFGPDHYLYIGVGDGGGANDTANNAQDLDVLLGKILRIDVDPPEGAGPYVSPSTNPYFGAVAGRDEIFAYGMRNPWRFSFDILTGQQWIADVGQGAREEIDTPIVRGGNYGWRVYEGALCTNNDPSLCGNPGYIAPLFDYGHSGGRCSVTGGYVYRGSANAVPDGTYVYGDYCTGEIFGWDGAAQTVLLNSGVNISSFGEDEAGELYVVGLAGSLSKLVATTPPVCTYAIAPTSQAFAAGGGTANVGVTAPANCAWTAASNAAWIRLTSGSTGTGNGTVGYAVDPNSTSTQRNGTMTIAGLTFSVSQSGAQTCSYAISPTRSSFSNAGGTGTISVTTAPGCAWTAASGDPWLIITAGTTGTGNGTVTYSVASYAGRAGTRNGKLAIAGQTFTVKQSK
jgi:hypothetical protein